MGHVHPDPGCRNIGFTIVSTAQRGSEYSSGFKVQGSSTSPKPILEILLPELVLSYGVLGLWPFSCCTPKP